jgi:hypothetical protein
MVTDLKTPDGNIEKSNNFSGGGGGSEPTFYYPDSSWVIEGGENYDTPFPGETVVIDGVSYDFPSVPKISELPVHARISLYNEDQNTGNKTRYPIDGIAEVQVGWKEIAAGQYKAKYVQNYSWAGTQNASGSVTLTGEGFNTADIQIIGVNVIFGILYSTGLQFRPSGHFDSVIQRCGLEIGMNTIVGTLLFTASSGLTGLRSVNAKIEYTKNADPVLAREELY